MNTITRNFYMVLHNLKVRIPIKVGPSPSKKKSCYFLDRKPFKNEKKNAFYFILKALFVLKIFRLLLRLFGHVGKTV